MCCPRGKIGHGRGGFALQSVNRDAHGLQRHHFIAGALARFRTAGLIRETGVRLPKCRHPPAAPVFPKPNVPEQEIPPSNPVLLSHRSRGTKNELYGGSRMWESPRTTSIRLRRWQETIRLMIVTMINAWGLLANGFRSIPRACPDGRQGPKKRVSLASL